MAIGNLQGGLIGPGFFPPYHITTNPTTYAMASLNAGWSARFAATRTADITNVYVNFSSVASAGTITCRIETSDANFKPSGTLYDANATKAFTPTAGWNTITFDTPPNSGMTIGTIYHVVLLTTTGGTTMTLNSSFGNGNIFGSYPQVVLTAADGTTRTNFAEVTITNPICSLGYASGGEGFPPGFAPYLQGTASAVYGTIATGLKFTLSTSAIFRGARWAVTKTGTPAGDLQLLLYSGSSLVSSSTITNNLTTITNSSTRFQIRNFDSLITLTAGTYRAVLYSPSSANSSNCWSLRPLAGHSSALVPPGLAWTSTTDLTAGTITWSDDATMIPPIDLFIDDLPQVPGMIMSRVFAGW